MGQNWNRANPEVRVILPYMLKLPVLMGFKLSVLDGVNTPGRKRPGFSKVHAGLLEV